MHEGFWSAGLLGTDCFQHLGNVEQNIAGSVHVDVGLMQERPVPLSEALTIEVWTEAVSAASRGPIAKLCFPLTLENGPRGPPLTKNDHPPPSKPRDGFNKISVRKLEPDHVKTYGGVLNPPRS